MYLYGASGHAKVIMDILAANHIRLEALIDDNPERNTLLGVPVLHTPPTHAEYLISIGNNRVRALIAEKLHQLGAAFITAIHPSALISPHATIEEGSVVMQGAIIQTCAQIGKHCIINTGASVDHECIIGDFVHISPHATLCGNVQVGEGTWIGAGSTIIQGITIGKNSIVGAGSVVTHPVPDGVLVAGNRAKIIKKLSN